MKTKKFPVISETTGQEYLVKIQDVESIFSEKYVKVSVYIKRKFLWWEYFGQVNDEWDNWYRTDVWEYDFISMAVNEVTKLETEIMNDLRNETLKERGFNAFEKWDGKIMKGEFRNE